MSILNSVLYIYICVCVTLGIIGILLDLFGFPFNFMSKQGARGRMDGTSQRRPIHVVVIPDLISLAYLRFSFLSEWREAKPRTSKF